MKHNLTAPQLVALVVFGALGAFVTLFGMCFALDCAGPHHWAFAPTLVTGIFLFILFGWVTSIGIVGLHPDT